AEIEAEPLKRNADLGYYTTFTNLLDLCAVAVPSAFSADGLPVGMTLMAPAGHDSALLELGARMHAAAPVDRLGVLKAKAPPTPPPRVEAANPIRLAVVGAHLRGQPLNHQLTALDARL